MEPPNNSACAPRASPRCSAAARGSARDSSSPVAAFPSLAVTPGTRGASALIIGTRHRSTRRRPTLAAPQAFLPPPSRTDMGGPRSLFPRPGAQHRQLRPLVPHPHPGCWSQMHPLAPPQSPSRAGRFALVDRRLPAPRCRRRIDATLARPNPRGQLQVGLRPNLPRTGTSCISPGPAEHPNRAPASLRAPDDGPARGPHPHPARSTPPRSRWSQDLGWSRAAIATPPTPTSRSRRRIFRIPDRGRRTSHAPSSSRHERSSGTPATPLKHSRPLRCPHVRPHVPVPGNEARPRAHMPLDERTTEAAVIVSTVSRTTLSLCASGVPRTLDHNQPSNSA